MWGSLYTGNLNETIDTDETSWLKRCEHIFYVYEQYKENLTLEKTYKCSECVKPLPVWTVYLMYQKIHTREKCFECKEYEKAFRILYNLIEHQFILMWNHSNVRNVWRSLFLAQSLVNIGEFILVRNTLRNVGRT